MSWSYSVASIVPTYNSISLPLIDFKAFSTLVFEILSGTSNVSPVCSLNTSNAFLTWFVSNFLSPSPVRAKATVYCSSIPVNLFSSVKAKRNCLICFSSSSRGSNAITPSIFANTVTCSCSVILK